MAGLLDNVFGKPQRGAGLLGLVGMPGLGMTLQEIANPQLAMQRQALEQANQIWPSILGQQQPMQPMQQPMMQPAQQPGATVPPGMSREADAPNFGNAIASIESGGKYDALGPVTKTGDRAYGKYQVMGANIGPWSKEVLGQEVSPQQFLASPELQDKIFQGKFGQYVQKHGPEGAARAWFAGEGGMNDMGRKDQLGTTVAAYGQKFAQAAGLPQQPQQMAQPQQVAQQPMMSPNMQGLMRLMRIQGLPKADYDMASKLFDRELDNSKLTETQKDYFRAQADPSFANFKRPGEMKMLKDDLGNETPYSFNQNTQSLTPLPVPGAQGSKPPEAMIKELRKEVQDLPSYKNVAQAAPVYKSMTEAAGRDNRAADVNLIYGFAKIMDPGSVVRESEMTIAQAVATLPQHMRATIMSQLQATGRLSPEVREAIMQEAHSRMSAYKTMFDQDASQFRGIAARRRMNLEDVLPNFGEFKEWTKPKPSPTNPGQPQVGGGPPVAINPQTGQRLILSPDGKSWLPAQGM